MSLHAFRISKLRRVLVNMRRYTKWHEQGPVHDTVIPMEPIVEEVIKDLDMSV